MKNKKAAISATMTWIVATIIILFVIILFVYASKTLATSDKFKKILGDLSIFAEKDKAFSSMDSEQMLLALLQTEDSKNLKSILETIPALVFSVDLYVFVPINEATWVLEKDEEIIRGDDKSSRVVYEETKSSFVYIAKNKKANLFLDCLKEVCK